MQNAASPAFLPQDPEATWWQEFEDPELDGLERRALAANLDLRMALDRVRAARAIFVEQNYDYAPHVPVQGGYAKSVEQEPGLGLSRITAESDSLGFDATWEIDLFGHVRRSVEAARADLGCRARQFPRCRGDGGGRGGQELLRASRRAAALRRRARESRERKADS